MVRFQTLQTGTKKNIFTEKPANWLGILQQLQLSAKMDFYEMLYKPLVQQRIKTIVKSSWNAAIKQTEKDILIILNADEVNWTSKYACICKNL